MSKLALDWHIKYDGVSEFICDISFETDKKAVTTVVNTVLNNARKADRDKASPDFVDEFQSFELDGIYASMLNNYVKKQMKKIIKQVAERGIEILRGYKLKKISYKKTETGMKVIIFIYGQYLDNRK